MKPSFSSIHTWRAFLKFGSTLVLVSAGCSPPPVDCPTPATDGSVAEAAKGPAPAAKAQSDVPGDSSAAKTAPHAHPPEGDDRKPLVHSFDDRPAESWAERFDAPERDAWQKPAEVTAALGLTPGMRVADVGAGTGYFLPHLSTAVGDDGLVLAVDIAPSLVRHMKARVQEAKLPNVHVALALTDDPLLQDDSVDRILIVDTWHHIAERDAYAQKLVRALAQGGSLWIVDFKMDSPEGPPKHHRLLPEQVASELKAAGLAVRTDTALLPRQYLVSGTRQ